VRFRCAIFTRNLFAALLYTTLISAEKRQPLDSNSHHPQISVGESTEDIINCTVILPAMPLHDIAEASSKIMSPLDQSVASHRGTTSAIDMLPHQLPIHKATPYKDRVDELTRENDYLRRELAYYKDIQVAMLEFNTKAAEASHTLDKALGALSEKRLTLDKELPQLWGTEVEERVAEIQLL
jgi:hypothetical protein